MISHLKTTNHTRLLKCHYQIKMKKYKVDKIYISELGYLMVTLYDKEKKVWTSINLGDWKKNLNLNTDKINIEDIEQ